MSSAIKRRNLLWLGVGDVCCMDNRYVWMRKKNGISLVSRKKKSMFVHKISITFSSLARNAQDLSGTYISTLRGSYFA